MLAALVNSITKCSIEGFCGEGRVQLQMREALFTRAALEFVHERRPDTTSTSSWRDIAREHLGADDEQATDSDSVTIKLGH
jgi:hypothetical protein